MELRKSSFIILCSQSSEYVIWHSISRNLRNLKVGKVHESKENLSPREKVAVVLYSAAKNNRGYLPNDAEYIHRLFYGLKERHPTLFEDINFGDYKGPFPWSDEVGGSIQSLSSDGCIKYDERFYYPTEKLEEVVEKARKKMKS